MARRRRKSSSRKKAVRCKVIRVNGNRRKLCWGRKGKLVSNKAA